MVKRCVLGGCSNASGDGVPLFGWPDNSTTSKQWDAFVMTTRKDWVLGQGKKHHQGCAHHFTEEKFSNVFKWCHGYAALQIINGAVPSIFPAHVTEGDKKRFTRQAAQAGMMVNYIYMIHTLFGIIAMQQLGKIYLHVCCIAYVHVCMYVYILHAVASVVFWYTITAGLMVTC
jgi:hypothetical protein